MQQIPNELRFRMRTEPNNEVNLTTAGRGGELGPTPELHVTPSFVASRY